MNELSSVLYAFLLWNVNLTICFKCFWLNMSAELLVDLEDDLSYGIGVEMLVTSPERTHYSNTNRFTLYSTDKEPKCYISACRQQERMCTLELLRKQVSKIFHSSP